MRQWALVIIATLVVSTILTVSLSDLGLEWQLRDLIYQKPYGVDSRVVIVGIDEETLQYCGRWPFDRRYYSALIEYISKGKPSAFFIDVIFSESTEADRLLSETVAKYNVLIPAYALLESNASNGIRVNRWIFPVEAFNTASNAGHINIIPDTDGIMRRGLTVIQDKNTKVVSVAEWMAAQVSSYAQIPQSARDSYNRFYIHFAGIPGTMPYVSFASVLNGDVPPEYFEDKVVLIGPYTVGIGDYFNTAADHQLPMFGVEIHANIVNQILKGKFTSPMPFVWRLLLVFGLMMSFQMLLIRIKPFAATLLLLGLMGVYAVVLNLTRGLDVFFPLLPVGIGWSVLYLYHLIRKYFIEQKEKKRIVAMFSRYVAPQVVSEVIRQRASLHLGGTRRNVAVLFVDIRGFTPLSESATPEEVVEILNAYLTLCASAIFTCGGTLDKFIGDAAMAIFNAPLDQEDYVFKAVEAALLMKAGAESNLFERFGKKVTFGIGIHTGPAVIGNIGADFRMDYTAIGDTVNTAARLESNAKSDQILISEAVYKIIKNRIDVTPLGAYQVKGKLEQIFVFQVDGVKKGVANGTSS